ncbi:unnamed protein product [Hydatigera taeniaeformis]|uniref:CTNNB1 binding N-teminal domain-containing protein n=1 Tax=Hydatigena taeniaeformis TaxID=6205 RepID=A0A0R3WVM7_HYDTA|nr:unnamed protein product [Hydatigera taeniaeformis]
MPAFGESSAINQPPRCNSRVHCPPPLPTVWTSHGIVAIFSFYTSFRAEEKFMAEECQSVEIHKDAECEGEAFCTSSLHTSTMEANQPSLDLDEVQFMDVEDVESSTDEHSVEAGASTSTPITGTCCLSGSAEVTAQHTELDLLQALG